VKNCTKQRVRVLIANYFIYLVRTVQQITGLYIQHFMCACLCACVCICGSLWTQFQQDGNSLPSANSAVLSSKLLK